MSTGLFLALVGIGGVFVVMVGLMALIAASGRITSPPRRPKPRTPEEAAEEQELERVAAAVLAMHLHRTRRLPPLVPVQRAPLAPWRRF